MQVTLDDNKIDVVKDDINEAIESLERATVVLLQWFSDNQMKANPDKCYFITSKGEDIVADVENNPIKNSKYEILLNVK